MCLSPCTMEEADGTVRLVFSPMIQPDGLDPRSAVLSPTARQNKARRGPLTLSRRRGEAAESLTTPRNKWRAQLS